MQGAQFSLYQDELAELSNKSDAKLRHFTEESPLGLAYGFHINRVVVVKLRYDYQL